MTTEDTIQEGRKSYSFEEYASFWGDGSSSDDCMFYNFSQDGHDHEFLRGFIPAIDRTIKMLKEKRRRDAMNLRLLKAECERRLAEPEPAPLEFPNDRNTFQDSDGETVSYAEVRRLMKGEPFPMGLVGDEYRLVAAAINQGIDSHLEACFVPSRGDSKGPDGYRVRFSFSPESLPVLLRRLFEDDYDEAQSLASDILSVLRNDD